MENVFWASKIHFLLKNEDEKLESYSREVNGYILDDFSQIYGYFFPLFFTFLIYMMLSNGIVPKMLVSDNYASVHRRIQASG